MANPVDVVVKVKLSEFNNDWYYCGASKLKRGLWYFINVFFFINPLNPFSHLKIKLLRIFGSKIGSGVVIKPNVNIKYPWNLSIGNYSWVGEEVWIDNLAYVHIGNNVVVSQGAMLLTGSHDYKSEKFDLIVKEIFLEDGSWVGAKAVVCPGVVCHTHCVLSVGSVATKDLDSYGVYQGIPAEKKRERLLVNLK
jgi:putative colanic acid biosynthesis acetyltransferase WcaF